LVDNLKVLDPFFKNLTVVVMPLSYFNIKEVVAEILDVLQVLFEDALKLLKTLLNFRALSTTENRHADLGALASKL
jgi:hypothetical protein